MPLLYGTRNYPEPRGLPQRTVKGVLDSLGSPDTTLKDGITVKRNGMILGSHELNGITANNLARMNCDISMIGYKLTFKNTEIVFPDEHPEFAPTLTDGKTSASIMNISADTTAIQVLNAALEFAKVMTIAKIRRTATDIFG